MRFAPRKALAQRTSAEHSSVDNTQWTQGDQTENRLEEVIQTMTVEGTAARLRELHRAGSGSRA